MPSRRSALSKLKPTTLRCRVFPFLLFICYLEVVLWTSCLLISCVPVAASEFAVSHNYLLREKGNLGLAAPGSLQAVTKEQHSALRHTWAFELASPATVERYVKACWRGISRGLQQSLDHDNTDLLQPALTTLRSLGAEESSGLPAPYTGIKAIS